jgi:hypothetical protein
MSDIRETLEDAADSFPPTLKQSEVEGLVFMLDAYRRVETKFGSRQVAGIRFGPGETPVEAWLAGALVDRQLKALSDKDLLPCLVKLGRRHDIDGSPYVLECPAEDESRPFNAADEAPSEDGKPEEPPASQSVNLKDLLDEACLLEGVEVVVAALSEAGLDESLDLDESGQPLFKDQMPLSQRARAIRILRGLLTE